MIKSYETINCSCGYIFEAEKYETINAVANPELVDRLLKDTLTVAICPKCNAKIRMEYPIRFTTRLAGSPIQYYPYDDIKDVEHQSADIPLVQNCEAI